jgi:hypothetical protein
MSNWLVHHHPTNREGSPLVRIDFFNVRYHYPTPWDDPHQCLAEQNGPPPEQVEPAFWSYDVATRKGHWLDTAQ